ncbi:alpha-galactosidase [Sphingobacterium sp.]|uniref:alpha-galactosidase n=1 Tax=Sphingobacterium sp. TaxID=341027 RepID=UPI0028B1B0D6|nr:alpha-galactosidase [Sphingobacterium sp.]
MRINTNLILIALLAVSTVQNAEGQKTQPAHKDWLIQSTGFQSKIVNNKDEIVLENGLIRRAFKKAANLACYDFSNLSNGQQLIRAIEPEAIVNINGKDYEIGGLKGQKEKAYFLTEWFPSLKANPDAFVFKSAKESPLEHALNSNSPFWSSNSEKAKGIGLVLEFQHPELAGVSVDVHYEIYDGMPVLRKWVEVRNESQTKIQVNRLVNEILSLVEEESAVVGSTEDMKKQSGIYFETNYAFNNAMKYRLSEQTLDWERDSSYTSQVNYDLTTPAKALIYPKDVSKIDVLPKQKFTSVKTFELLHDSHDQERRGLAVRQMYRRLTPWTNANPIFMHLVSKNREEVITAIDQCAATGYEAVILSFGSHLKMELNTPENHKEWRELADYAKSKGVKLGGYTLFSSRTIDAETDVINPKTGKPGGAFFGNAPCFGSQWGLDYAQAIKDFFRNTGFSILEMDGPYPGDVCASHDHPGHHGLEDSQFAQMEIQKSIFHELNQMGVYINAPDWYFLDGTNKIALGYREVNFSLSRDQQKILNRQNIYDGTWEKTPSMGWGFVPLTAYHGGGADAVLEPLNDHLEDYKQLMMQYYGAGVQACYRGPRLYDTERTKAAVIEVIDWYKKYRDILNADIIHLRRADGRNWDGILHVDPNGKEKGLGMLYNPTDREMVIHIDLPLYYTGLDKDVQIAFEGENPKKYQLARDYKVNLPVKIPAKGYTWFTVK